MEQYLQGKDLQGTELSRNGGGICNEWTLQGMRTVLCLSLLRRQQYLACYTCTLCLKKGTPTLSIVTLKRINGFWQFFAQTFLIQLAIKWYFKFPPHPKSVSTLPGENTT